MSREFPDWLDPWKAAEGRRRFVGTVPLSSLPRVQPLLAVADGLAGEAADSDGGPAQGDVRFDARFALDEERRPVLKLRIEAELPLVCQRSLKVYRHALERESTLHVLDHEAEQRLLGEHAEATLTENGRLRLASVIEEELLLGMPDVPRDPDAEPLTWVSQAPGPAPEDEASPARKPFEALRDLLKDKA